MKTLAIIAFSIMIYGIPSLIIITHMLHYFLTKKLDSIWFNDKFYNINELAIYSSYPLSLVRSLSYIAAVCLPYVARKRYDDLAPVKDLNLGLKLLCFVWLILFILAVAMAIIFVASYFVLKWSINSLLFFGSKPSWR